MTIEEYHIEARKRKCKSRWVGGTAMTTKNKIIMKSESGSTFTIESDYDLIYRGCTWLNGEFVRLFEPPFGIILHIEDNHGYGFDLFR